MFRLLRKYFNRIIIQTFEKHLFCFEHPNHFMLFKVYFKQYLCREEYNIQQVLFLSFYRDKER